MDINLYQIDTKWLAFQENCRKIESQLHNAKPNSLCIFPEMFTTGFVTDPLQYDFSYIDHQSYVLDWMSKMTEKYQISLLGSIVWKEGEQFYNRLLFQKPNSELLHYDKVKLFSISKEVENFQEGEDVFIWELNGVSLRGLVCYDLRFPSLCFSAKDYMILIYVANWPEVRIQHWKKLLAARAIENQCYVIGVNRVGEDENGLIYNGQSQVLDYEGNILASAGKDEKFLSESLNLESLANYRNKYPFIQDQ